MPHTLNLLDWLASTGPLRSGLGPLPLARRLSGGLVRPAARRPLGSQYSRQRSRPRCVPARRFRPPAVDADTRRLHHGGHAGTGAQGAGAKRARRRDANLRMSWTAARFCPAPDAGAAVRASLGIGADEAVLGFCGELREKKGLTHLMDALLDSAQGTSCAAAADRRCAPVRDGAPAAMDRARPARERVIRDHGPACHRRSR